MSLESFDNINQDELQASIEAELRLFENSNSGQTYMEIESFPGNFQRQEIQMNLPNQGENSPNLSSQTSPALQKTPTKIEKKKRDRFSVEFKSKILLELGNSSQAELARLYNIDRRLIGKWAKPENKEKISNVVGKRNTFRIETESKSWWPELEHALFVWFKEQRQKGACVSESCFKLQGLTIFEEIYRNATGYVPRFCAFVQIKKIKQKATQNNQRRKKINLTIFI